MTSTAQNKEEMEWVNGFGGTSRQEAGANTTIPLS
jgi:hypothetical protein